MGLTSAEKSAVLGKVIVDREARDPCSPCYFSNRRPRRTHLFVEFHRGLDDPRPRLPLTLGPRLELVLSGRVLPFA
jgi:hypothetical protein